MKEDKIIEFRSKAIPYFRQIFLKYNYEIEQAENLSFYLVKVLEDALPLLQNFEQESNNIERVISNIHLFYTNQQAFEEGKKILMWENNI